MSAVAPNDERTEAVIISGPRRGQIVQLPESAMSFSSEEEAIVRQMIASASRIAEMAKSMAEETEALTSDLCRGRSE